MTFRFRNVAAALAAILLGIAAPAWAAPVVEGPQKGTLIIAGGGKLGLEIVGRFIALAGGPSANIVVIPTAGEEAIYGPIATA
jgi:cyanophycinase